MEFVHSIENGSMELRISPEGIYLDQLWIDEGHRRLGLGTILMMRLCEFADQMGLPVSLHARSDNLRYEEIVPFYEKHGFVLRDDRIWVVLMDRAPR